MTARWARVLELVALFGAGPLLLSRAPAWMVIPGILVGAVDVPGCSVFVAA